MPRKKAADNDAAQLQSRTQSSSTSSTQPNEKPTAKKSGTAASTTKSTSARRTKRAAKTDQAETAQPPSPSADPPLNGTWRRIDLHIHTPASHDYEEPDKSYLDILKQAERRGLSIIAFTDHNTVNGYRNMLNEIEHLEYLETLDRIRPDELARLNEYRRLLKKILVLPGFEFTATFGFHILGIFSPDKPLRDIERVLMDLRVPGHVLDKGLTEAGATSDVLQAYEAIDEAGGIAIAAHANSSNGVSMRGLNLGGQTRIAFTQDPHLHAIEFTDLDKGRYSSAYLFTGVKPEYPRRMFAIQGSDAHRLSVSKENAKRLGVGERATEVLLEEVSFAALRDVFLSQDFSRVRPVFDVLDLPEDSLLAARKRGVGATTCFYPTLPKRGDRFEAVLRDVCAMANGEGGDIFVGCDANPNKKVAGLADAHDAAQKLATEMEKRIAPRLVAPVRVQTLEGAEIVHVQVPRGADAPYAVDETAFYVRQDAETRPAKRDEIVALARRGYEKPRPPEQRPAAQPPAQLPVQSPERRPPHGPQRPQQPDKRQHEQRKPQPQPRHPQAGQPARAPQPQVKHHERDRRHATQKSSPPRPQPTVQANEPTAIESIPPAILPPADNGAHNGARPTGNGEAVAPGIPKTGVQVLDMEERNGTVYFTVRDLRNNSTIRNVTLKSARDLWHYAITQFADHPSGPEDVEWHDDRAVLSREMRAGKMRSDLAIRDANGRVTVFYGVTDDGLDERWKRLIAEFGAGPRAATEPAAAEDADAP